MGELTFTTSVNESDCPTPRFPRFQTTFGEVTAGVREEDLKVSPAGSVSVTTTLLAIEGPVLVIQMV